MNPLLHSKKYLATSTLKSRRINRRSVGFTTTGFTIAELIIVIAIFSIITSVALLDQGRLNSNVLITNLGYETALAVHEAQIYGVGVRNFSTSTIDNTFGGQFGTYFNIASPTSIILYNDRSGDTIYDSALPDNSSEALYEYAFTNQRGNKIKALCLGPSSPCQTDTDPGNETGTQVSELRILFKRPGLEAHFYKGNSDSIERLGPAYIVVNNLDNTNCRVVIIEQTGQIRVERATDSSTACSNQ